VLSTSENAEGELLYTYKVRAKKTVNWKQIL